VTAATAYDLCIAAADAAKRGSVAHRKALAALRDWEQHPALRAVLTWSKTQPGACSVRTNTGRYVGRAATVKEAILIGHAHGKRVFDTAALGHFAPVSP
jgi:hypothetical protein